MADLKSWSQENLANLAADQQAEIVRLNNQDCERLKLITELLAAIESLCDISTKNPLKMDAYRAGRKVVGK